MCYNFRLKIEKLSGSPLNSECECPAGKGPNATCKHKAAVMLMFECFSQTGVIQVQKTCTQDLQTFQNQDHITMVNILFTTHKCTFKFQVFFVKCHSVENRGVFETISYKADQRLFCTTTSQLLNDIECDLTKIKIHECSNGCYTNLN